MAKSKWSYGNKMIGIIGFTFYFGKNLTPYEIEDIVNNAILENGLERYRTRKNQLGFLRDLNMKEDTMLHLCHTGCSAGQSPGGSRAANPCSWLK